jgi:purine-nucleoside phosphorylase
VEGHKGRFIVGAVGGVRTLVLQGRVHAYEGWDPGDVVFGVRTLALLGVRAVVLTNAAGGLNREFSPGDLMVLTDHLNLAGWNPLSGPNDERLGTRFPDLTDAYDPTLSSALHAAADGLGQSLRQGVYAGMLGPSYETPAEIAMLRTLGADAVGMSTVPECIALRHMGVAVSGISCITNLAAGISPVPLSHDEVKETGARVAQEFVALLTDAVPRLAEAVT